MTQLDY